MRGRAVAWETEGRDGKDGSKKAFEKGGILGGSCMAFSMWMTLMF